MYILHTHFIHVTMLIFCPKAWVRSPPNHSFTNKFMLLLILLIGIEPMYCNALPLSYKRLIQDSLNLFLLTSYLSYTHCIILDLPSLHECPY